MVAKLGSLHGFSGKLKLAPRFILIAFASTRQLAVWPDVTATSRSIGCLRFRNYWPGRSAWCAEVIELFLVSLRRLCAVFSCRGYNFYSLRSRFMYHTCSIPTGPEATYKKRRIGQMLVNFGPLSMPPVASQQVARESGISAMVVTAPGPRGCQRARWSVNDMIWASKRLVESMGCTSCQNNNSNWVDFWLKTTVCGHAILQQNRHETWSNAACNEQVRNKKSH